MATTGEAERIGIVAKVAEPEWPVRQGLRVGAEAALRAAGIPGNLGLTYAREERHLFAVATWIMPGGLILRSVERIPPRSYDGDGMPEFAEGAHVDAFGRALDQLSRALYAGGKAIAESRTAARAP